MCWGSLCLRATRRSSGHIHRAVHILVRVRAANKAYFIRLAKSRCGMPARRAPNRLACVALHSVTVAIGLCSVRLPRMGATQYSRWTELHSLGATLLLAPAYVRLPLRLSHPGLGSDVMISHSQGSFQWDSAGAGHSCHRFFARHYDCRLCRMEGATLRPVYRVVFSLRHIAHRGGGGRCTDATPSV